MTPRFQLFALLGVIEEFAVEDYLDGAVFIANGLPAIEQADNTQSSIAQTDIGPVEKSILIGPAMENRCRHSAHNVRRGFLLAR
jgi:hypothetical protein